MGASIIACVIKILILLLLISNQHANANGCFESIISFGDSLTDTGNLLDFSKSSRDQIPHFALPPYGETFFHRPTGRCSNGRLIIDFIAESVGLPLVPPYLGGKNSNNSIANFGKGVNFAVAGASALDAKFFEERGIPNPATNVSLGTQLGWFKDLLPSLCGTHSNCTKLLSRSLVLVGEIGLNDYNFPLLYHGENREEVLSFVPLVIDIIGSTIEELIKHGALTIMVPGNVPMGCMGSYLTYFKSTNKEQYDPFTGCLTWLNKFAEWHNTLLQIKLNRIRELHPNVNIIYADYYNSAMRFFHSPQKFGFTEGALKACCGAGGPYNYNSSVPCASSPSSDSCSDPSSYADWDGLHFTEAAYKWIAKGLLEGPYTIPRLSTNALCLSTGIPSGHSQDE